jgi:hypothetical protein
LESVPHLAGSHLDWRTFQPSSIDWEIFDLALQYCATHPSDGFRGYTLAYTPFPLQLPVSLVAKDQQVTAPPLPFFSLGLMQTLLARLHALQVGAVDHPPALHDTMSVFVPCSYEESPATVQKQ